MKHLALLLLVLCACDCHPSVVLVPAPAPIAGDAGDVCALAMVAASACACPWATEAGVTACRRDQAQGAASQLSPECLAFSAGNCNALKACPGVTGCQ